MNNKITFADRRISILNYIAYFTIVAALFHYFVFSFRSELSHLVYLKITIAMAVAVSIITLFLQKKKLYVLARTFYISLISVTMLIHTNYVFYGTYSEYNYIAIPLLSIIFFDKIAIHLSFLIGSLAIFYIPNHFLHIYEIQNFGFFDSAFIFIASFSFVLFFKIVNKKNEKLLIVAYDQLELTKKKELELLTLKVMQSQMNPHFIFNSLNSLQDLIIKDKKETSYDYIVMFSELVRSLLNNSKKNFIPIEDEFEFLDVYLKLEKLRFGEEFNYELITNNIDELHIPSLIIQPLLENALFQGLIHKKGEKSLTVEFKLDEELLCIITDNGIGREESKRIKNRRGDSQESFAISTIEERLNLLGESLDYRYKFEVEDLYEYDIPKGTKTTISIPFEEEYYRD